MADLPSREEAQGLWIRFDNVEMGESPSAVLASARADGTLQTKQEFIDSLGTPIELTAYCNIHGGNRYNEPDEDDLCWVSHVQNGRTPCKFTTQLGYTLAALGEET